MDLASGTFGAAFLVHVIDGIVALDGDARTIRMRDFSSN
jgi:hypothetical protein